jgi:NAD(P)H-dependent FMN reductase
MSKPIRILGIAGSLRRESYNRATLRAATELMAKGAILETFELDGIPVFNQDEEQNAPAKVTELKRRIREADAILFVTPEYNYSVSGVLKNVIDWASRLMATVRGTAKRPRSWAPRREPSAPRVPHTICARFSCTLICSRSTNPR